MIRLTKLICMYIFNNEKKKLNKLKWNREKLLGD